MLTGRASGSGGRWRRLAMLAGVAVVASGTVVAVAQTASAGAVSADDSRATVGQGNINACPAGTTTLVDGDSTTTQNGITVTVTHTAASQLNPFPAGGVTTLPAGTDVLTVTLPAGKTLTGDIYVKGGDGYNDYPGSALTSLIPPVNTGGTIAALSHFFVCGSLTQPTASVSVTKVVSGSGTGSSGTFAVEVDCGAGHDSTVTLSGGDTKTVTGIPGGTSCTVTETGTGQSTSHTYTVGAGAAGATPPTFAVVGGQTTAVTVTNTYAPATVQVTKTVVGTAPAGVTTFPINIVCGATTTTLTLANGGTGSASAPGGTTCSVTETDAHGATTTYSVAGGGSAAGFVLTNGATTHVTVTNTYAANPPADGQLTVDKVVAGSPLPPAGTLFPISATCGGTTTAMSLAAGGSQTVSGLAPGTQCTVTETNPEGASAVGYAVDGGSSHPAVPVVTIASGATSTVTVTNTYVPVNATSPHLTIAKSAVPASGSTVHRGNTIDYTLSYANTGNADATVVSVVDTLPADTTFVVGSATPAATYDATARTLTWTLGTVTAGSSGTVTYSLTVATTAVDGEHLNNVAVISDPTQTAVSDPTVHIVNVPADPLSIVKSVDKTTALYGDNLTYTLKVISGSGAAPQDVVVTDSVPADTDFVSATCANPCTVGAPVGGVVTWHVGGMSANSSVTVSFVVHIIPLAANAPPTAETILNSAVVSSLGTADVPSNTVSTDVPAVLGETFTQPPPSTPGGSVVPAVSTSHGSALPFTGLPAEQLLGLAGMLLAAGAALTLAGLRRRTAGDR